MMQSILSFLYYNLITKLWHNYKHTTEAVWVKFYLKAADQWKAFPMWNPFK